MKTKIKKLYKGFIVDLRSDNVEKCIAKNENYEVTVEGKIGMMTLTPEQLKKDRLKESKPFESKFGVNKTYKLFSYRWKENV